MRYADPHHVADVVRHLGGRSIEAAFLFPTTVAMQKSIMDATESLREFLYRKGIHDFSIQPQGPRSKRFIEAEFIHASKTVSTKVSLYRPLSKEGDPRIWIYNLRSYAAANDLLAVIVLDSRMYILNASRPEILATLNDHLTPLGAIAERISGSVSETAHELLERLKAICQRGFLPTVTPGDTGVGATLEELLGIAKNCRRSPDYRNIELKASRHGRTSTRSKNRVNLFSQVPDWKIGPVSSARMVLQTHGYPDPATGRMQLYCTVSASKPNSQELQLIVDDRQQLLKIMFRGETEVMVWPLSKLRDRLAEKHPESFWVKAESKVIEGREHFHYYRVIHTANPMIANMSPLLADGTITLDLTMSESGNGVRDHGYLFKIRPESFLGLFPQPRVHLLT